MSKSHFKKGNRVLWIQDRPDVEDIPASVVSIGKMIEIRAEFPDYEATIFVHPARLKKVKRRNSQKQLTAR